MTKDKTPAERPFAWGRVIATAFALIASGVLTYFFGGLLQNKTDVLSFIASIFSILAGVLLAIVSILGDPSMLLDGTWRHSYLSALETQRKIHRQTNIFVVYVILLGSLFIFLLMDPTSKPYWYVQHICFFFTCLAFFASIGLPYTLRKIQKLRLERAIDQRSSSG